MFNPQELADFCEAARKEGDGYIMGSIGQDPKGWAVNSWWFAQYTNAKQHAKALYWRENAPRVFDCQGLEDGFETAITGVKTNVRARVNYASYCTTKGTGKIPSKYRVPGAAVFYHNGSYVSHVGFLIMPVNSSNPDGDWYVDEARGVMYGVVRTKLLSRSWNRWGLMDKRYDYTDVLAQYHGTTAADTATTAYTLGSRTLRNGSKGTDVAELQTALLSLGYDDLGTSGTDKNGVDGDFGSLTETALKAWQAATYDIEADGVYEEDDHAALMEALAELDDETDEAAETVSKTVKVVKAGSWRIRKGPGTSYGTLTVVPYGTELPYVATADTGWFQVEVNGTTGYISNKCAEILDA